MTTVATLDTVMRLNSSAFRAGMVQAAAQANASLSSINKKAASVTSTLLGLKRAAETFGSFYLVKEGLTSLIEAQKQLQSIHYSLISATGSETKAADAMAYLRAESQKLGLNLPVVSEEFSKLSAAATASSVSMKDQKELFDAFAKASTTLHLSADRSGRALLALQEMFSRGTIQSRQLNQQLGQAIPGSAARFKNAVMEMVKGTDLQGQSFEKLIQEGKLVTTQFAPALVKALQGAGSGWEQASTALNANLNRLSTAWFNLKTEVSSGLFNDAATAGAGALADNLSRIASALTLIGAGGLARITGGALQSGQNRVVRLQQEYRGARMAAAAEVERATAIETAAAAEVAEAARLRDVQVKGQEGIATIRAANRERLLSAEILRKMAQDQIALSAAEAQRMGALAEVVRTRNGFIAAENLAVAESTQAVAAAEAKRVQTAVALTEALSRQGVAEKAMVQLTAENTAAQQALAAADLEVARAKAFAAAEDPQLTALIARRDAAVQALAASEAQLAKATALEAEATRGAIALKEQAAAADAQVIKANLALEASEDALAAAQARVAETRAAEAALGGLGAAAGRAAKSFGAFALSLVGGPWGLAIAAIAGIGYAVYSVQKQGEEWRAETQKEVKSLKDLTENAKAAADEYGRLGSNLTISQGLDTLSGSVKEIGEKNAELAKLRTQAEQLRVTLNSNAANPNAGTAIVSWFDQRKLGQVTARIKELEAEMPIAEHAAQGLSSKLASSLAPAVDGLKEAVARLRSGGTILDAIGALATPDQIEQATKAVIAGQQKANAAVEAIEALGAKAHKDLLTKGVSRLAQAKAELALGVEGIKAEHLLAADEAKAIADLTSTFDKQSGTLRSADIRDNARKTASAINVEAEAYKSLKSQIDSRIEQDKEAAADTDKLTAAQKLQIKVLAQFKDGKTKLNAADQERVKQLLAEAVAQGSLTRATLQQRSADKALLDLDRQLGEQRMQQTRVNARQLEGIGHGSQWNEQRAAIEAIQDAYRKQREEADKAYESAKLHQGASIILDNQHAAALGKITAAEQEAIVAQQKFFDDQKAANADWSNGFSKAIEDFQTQQQNNAAAAAKMVDDLTSGFDTAFVSFVSGTASAKEAFGSFIDDMYKQALKFLADKAIQALFDSFGMSGKAQTSGSTAGGWDSLLANLGTAIFGGGRAGGGYVAPHTVYQVAEQGPEVLQVGGRSLLMMGNQSGNVVPNHQLHSTSSTTYVTNINVQPTSTRRTADQVATAASRAQRTASMRNA